METAMHSDVEAKFRALQIVSRIAYDYIENLMPGDIFHGIPAEAARRFDVGSEGYGLFIGCAEHHMTEFVMDLDSERRIISIARLT